MNEPVRFVALDRVTAAVAASRPLVRDPSVSFPAYYYACWIPSGLLSPAQHLTWQYLVGLVGQARADLENPLITQIVLPLDMLARALNVRSSATVRSQVVRPIREARPVSLFIPEAVPVPSGYWSGRLPEGVSPRLGTGFAVALTVPVLPAEEGQPEAVPRPEQRSVRFKGVSLKRNAGESDSDSSVEASGIDWSTVRASSGGWVQFRDTVVEPVLLAAGEQSPRAKVEAARTELAKVLDSLGWARAVDAVYRIAPYLDGKRSPFAYLRKALNSTDGTAFGAPRVTPASQPNQASVERKADVIKVIPASTAPESSEPRRPFQFDRSAFLASWLKDLEGSPSRRVARQALDFVRSRQSSGLSASEKSMVLEIEKRANEALDTERSTA